MATKKTVETAVEATTEVNTTEQVSSDVSEAVTEVSKTDSTESIGLEETRYTKEQIVESKQYKGYVDVLNTILGDRKYTLSEVNNLLNEFLSKEVE